MNNKGFSLIEVVLSVAIFSLLILVFGLFFISFSKNVEVNKQRLQIEQLGIGIQKSAKLIIDIYTPYCSTSSSNNLGWGWRRTGCNNTIIFPNLSSNNNTLRLTYTYNSGTLTPDEQNKLKSGIATYFNFCNTTYPNANTIVVNCPMATNAMYCIATSTDCNNASQLVTSVHTAGSSYNYIDNKIISLVVEYNEEYARQTIQHRIGNTNVYDKPYFIDFGSFFVEMFSINKQRFIDIFNALKKYEVTKRIMEAQNPTPTGLTDTDDYFIPWAYQITSSTYANAYTLCNNTTCSNLQNNNYWNRGIAATNMLLATQNVKNYLLGNSPQYMLDAFGNPLGIELVVNMSNYDGSSCKSLYSPSGGSATNCLRFVPPYPQNNYSIASTVKPPFIGYIYSEFCHDLSILRYNDCRMSIVYVN